MHASDITGEGQLVNHLQNDQSSEADQLSIAVIESCVKCGEQRKK